MMPVMPSPKRAHKTRKQRTSRAVSKRKIVKRDPCNVIPLQKLYDRRLPVKKAKYIDLMSLTRFLTKTVSRDFYNNIMPVDVPEDSQDEFIDDPPVDE